MAYISPRCRCFCLKVRQTATREKGPLFEKRFEGEIPQLIRLRVLNDTLIAGSVKITARNSRKIGVTVRETTLRCVKIKHGNTCWKIYEFHLTCTDFAWRPRFLILRCENNSSP